MSGVSKQQQNKYRFVAKKGSGAFADVIQAQNTKTMEMVAIKRLKQVYKSVDKITKLREIQALKLLQNHPTVVHLLEILFDRNTGKLAMVFELMTMNLYEIIKNKKQYLQDRQIKFYFFQMMDGLAAMHAAGYFHRDIKPENVLMKKQNDSYLTHEVKIADVGSCRQIDTPHPYTEYISTRWYRSPETILSDGVYGPEMDIFGSACLLFELSALFPLFPGKDELDQIYRIHSVLGTPQQQVMDRIRKGVVNNPIKGDFAPVKGTGIHRLATNLRPDCLDLLEKMLTYDPLQRLTASQVLQHHYFDDIPSILSDARAQKANKELINHLEKTWCSVRGLTEVPIKQKQVNSDFSDDEINRDDKGIQNKTIKQRVKKVVKHQQATNGQQSLLQVVPLQKKKVDQNKQNGPIIVSVPLPALNKGMTNQFYKAGLKMMKK
ncbi:Long-flagella protein, kinase, CMGC RCK [Spironucleus salmonicida]|uniref:Long-flagella protein, kinase, CMGC RCK n=1 Tax=Spironucleus salmonicida TaxID=348837 RepID=V6LV96_9EUKA|nr:Long-flagella protein, kinase, CMGC RCK [Spironucleus salmonicida]|eukprot:EST48515.1 Long-flagella protein, kinase, CMGC RCK [Spironucleus salmonicida]